MQFLTRKTYNTGWKRHTGMSFILKKRTRVPVLVKIFHKIIKKMSKFALKQLTIEKTDSIIYTLNYKSLMLLYHIIIRERKGCVYE